MPSWKKARPQVLDPGATQVSHEAVQISVLKARISELKREQEEFRHKKARSLSVPLPDLSGLPQDLSLQERRVLHDNSAGVGPQTKRGPWSWRT